jgi:EVE domain-containing protein
MENTNHQRLYWLWVRHPDNIKDRKSGKVYPQPWTCAGTTEEGDMALVYARSPTRAILKVVKVKSKAEDLPKPGEPKNWGSKCYFDDFDTFSKPLKCAQMKVNRTLKKWEAVHGNFQRSAFEIDPRSWDVLMGLLSKLNPSSERILASRAT